MKKIKVMLTVVIVMATIGGTLAIEMNREQEFCIAGVKVDGTCGNGSQQDPYQVCAGKVTGRIVAQNGLLRCTAATNMQGNCLTNCAVLALTTTN